MKRKFSLRAVSVGVLFTLATAASANDFNIPFINASELGNIYSGWAASAEDASTSFSNPAGLTYLNKSQQLVTPIVGLSGSTQFTGTQVTPPAPIGVPQSGTVSSKLRGFVPSIYYSIPVRDNLVVAFGQTVPFALGTSYSKDSVVRYAATRTQIAVLDVGPSVGYKFSDKFSVGLGFDIDRMMFKIHNMNAIPFLPDGETHNNLYGWGYGWHGGVLYRPVPCTRIGLSFNSQVMFHTSGNSTIFQPFPPGEIRITNQKSNAMLPARTQLTLYHDLNRRLALMGTIFYTNWSTLQYVTLQRVVLPGGATTSVSIPFLYHNTFDYSLGLNFSATEKWLLRTGLQFMNTPSNNRTRSVADPIGGGVLWGFGAHYQQNRCFGYDIAYAHGFFQDTKIHVASPVTTLDGNSSQNSNVLGLQITANI